MRKILFTAAVALTAVLATSAMALPNEGATTAQWNEWGNSFCKENQQCWFDLMGAEASNPETRAKARAALKKYED